jgi:hypothetical protein
MLVLTEVLVNTQSSSNELIWWSDNVDTAFNVYLHPLFGVCIYADASKNVGGCGCMKIYKLENIGPLVKLYRPYERTLGALYGLSL